ncbi:hypothetical protein E0765_11810 [Sulfuricurvum sp. IAE1]|uniref:hypothetical protein n=1 Tax=Sulfuricurvum sp. IAE1 TaxID=2546102 RepID=UPI001044BEE5|nr:hypothetical protein [Sulfuricurvum sp. IAE1]TDA62489.1 hypothetical protein E0765_11810 [Sulfuricurvum sp. IAE1]
MNTYITFVSWEDRFAESLKNDLKNHPDIQQIYFFYFLDEQFFTKTQKYVDTLESIVNNNDVTLKKASFSFKNYLETWKAIANKIEDLTSTDEVILNISTMPRNIIFTMLHFMDQKVANYEVTYYSPFTHGENLTKNPSKPQMILQHGGIMYPEKKTALIVILGHDIKRVYQLFNYFEPYVMLIGLGTDHQTKLPLDYNTEFEGISKKEIFKVNSFSHEEVFTALEEQIKPLLENYNILLCSLGPKIEAMGMYKVHKKYPDTALVYAPSKDYADDYSSGTNFTNVKTISSAWLKIDEQNKYLD